jgi:tetratricopeptide (TPR) repeat protein
VSTVEQAQDVMYSAWDAGTRTEAIALAREALAISRDCADAYNLLAEESARSLEEAVDLYREGVAAGERALGRDMFEDAVGHFWGLVETRPYMRARIGLALHLWSLGQQDEAVDHARELLRLNPNDNQGVRYTLAGWLMELARHEELERLLRDYEEDAMAAWCYARALLTFRTTGDSEDAREQLGRAVETNPHVPAFLLGKRKLPKRLPDYIGIGDEREAMSVTDQFGMCWSITPGALEWLRTQV